MFSNWKVALFASIFHVAWTRNSHTGSKNLLEDWLKLCDALLISITVQSILAMKLFKDFKLVFTQKNGSQI